MALDAYGPGHNHVTLAVARGEAPLGIGAGGAGVTEAGTSGSLLVGIRSSCCLRASAILSSRRAVPLRRQRPRRRREVAAYYLDGKPIERVQVVADARMLFVPGTSGSSGPVTPAMGDDDLDRT